MSGKRTVRPINKAPNLEPMALSRAVSRAVSEARGRFSSVHGNPTAIIGQLQVELVSAELQSYRQSGTQIRNAVPVLVTPDNIGDATGFVDAFRVFAMGYELDDYARLDVWRGRWQTFTLPNLTVTGIRPQGGLRIEYDGHPLGASYCLDCRRRSQVDSGRYGGPRTAKHRARVTAAGGGAYYVSDDCEGWDSVFAAALPGTAVQLSRWRTGSGIGRVWVSFGFSDDTVSFSAGSFSAGSFSWSGAVGFVGEPFRVFESAVLPGHTPPRVFVEWLCEKFRFPFCVRRHATGAGFNLER